MASTAVFGVTFVDVKGFPFNRYVPTGTNLGLIKIVHGGVSRNVCEDFANVGIPVEFVSVTDESSIGQDVAASLKRAGVKTDYIVSVPENGIGMWLAIMDENGDLAASTSQMPDVEALEKLLDEKGDEIVSECENIILEIDMSESISEKVLDLAEKHHKNVYVLSGNMSVIVDHPEFLTRISCFICNEIEAGKLFNLCLMETEPEEMLGVLTENAKKMSIPSMVITMGKDGSVFYDGKNGESGICSVIPTELVDSTGAGDAFFAGTVIGLTKGFDLKKSVHIGSKLASDTIKIEKNSCPVNIDFFDIF